MRKMLIAELGDGALLRDVFTDSSGFSRKAHTYGQRTKILKDDGITLVFYGRNDAEIVLTLSIEGPVTFARVRTNLYELCSEDLTQSLVFELRPHPVARRSREIFFLKFSAGVAKKVGDLDMAS